MAIVRNIEDAKALEGQEVGVSDWVTVDQHRIDLFAEATGDRQWIHVDPERAALPVCRSSSHAGCCSSCWSAHRWPSYP